MSIRNLLNNETEKQQWSKLKAYELKCENIDCENIACDNITVGGSPIESGIVFAGVAPVQPLKYPMFNNTSGQTVIESSFGQSDISNLQLDKLNKDGTIAMTGNLDLDGNDIINANKISSSSDVNIVANNIKINEGVNEYTLPSVRGASGQVIADVLGDGNLSWQTAAAGYNQDLNTFNSVEFKEVSTPVVDASTSLSIATTAVQLTLGNTNPLMNVFCNGNLDCKRDIECDGDILLSDGGTLQLGSTSTPSQNKCVSMLFLAGASFPAGRVVKIINQGGLPKVVPITTGDPDTTGVIGVSMEAATLNQNVLICIGGIFEACVENGITINIGEKLEVSNFGAPIGVNDGRVSGTAAGTGSIGQFGIAMSSGTGDLAGTVFIRGIYAKNEAF